MREVIDGLGYVPRTCTWELADMGCRRLSLAGGEPTLPTLGGHHREGAGRGLVWDPAGCGIRHRAALPGHVRGAFSALTGCSYAATRGREIRMGRGSLPSSMATRARPRIVNLMRSASTNPSLCSLVTTRRTSARRTSRDLARSIKDVLAPLRAAMARRTWTARTLSSERNCMGNHLCTKKRRLVCVWAIVVPGRKNVVRLVKSARKSDCYDAEGGSRFTKRS